MDGVFGTNNAISSAASPHVLNRLPLHSLSRRLADSMVALIEAGS